MQIELKSDRRFIFRFFLPPFILIAICLIALGIILTFSYDAESLISLIILTIFEITYAIVLLVFKYKKRPNYIFRTDEIVVERKGKKHCIKTENIEFMHYYPFKWYYAIIGIMLTSSFNEGAAMKIHVKEKNGEIYRLGYISKNNALKLKEMYPKLLTIYYSEKGRI